MSKAQIQKLIDTAPSSWLMMFKRYKLGHKPTVDQLIETVLEFTPTMRSSGARGKERHQVPNAVKQEAMDGLKLAHKHNWTSASGVGLVRAMQLVVRPKIWDRSVERMNNYFTRHSVDKNSAAIKSGRETWGPSKPSRGYIAWLAWGGDSGRDWASRQVMKTNPSNMFAIEHEKTRDQLGLTVLRLNSLTKKELNIVQSVQNAIINELPAECKQSAQRERMYAEQRKTQPLAGRCSLAAQAVWVLLGDLNGGNPNYLPMVIRAGQMGKGSDTHWFIVKLSDGTIIDPTAKQFGNKRIPYEKAQFNKGLIAQHLREDNGSCQLFRDGIWTPPKATQVLIDTIKRPRRRNGSTRLVPKEDVRMVGFCPKKTKIVEEYIPLVLSKLEEWVGEELLFPTPIRSMTEKEFNHGRSVIDSGHPNGAGHGQYDTIKMEVAINPNMGPFDLLANVFHENLHHALPDLSEEDVRDTTGHAMESIFGVFNLGRPYAEGRLKANPRQNPMAPGYQSYGWTTQSWRSLFLHSDGSITYDKKCGAKGTQLKDGRPRLCLPLYVIEQLIGSKQGRKILAEQIRKKERAKKGQRVSWHPTIKALHRELESMTPEDMPRLRSRRR